MAFPVPDLDKVDFESLVEQARSLIPRYAPQWTDHNVHDPGMTLIDLIAWLVDQESYQAGFISDAHLESFAALLGVQRQGVQAATGLIWPPLEPQPVIASAGVDLPKGAIVSCPDQPELGYQTEHAMYISAAKLVGLQTSKRIYDINAQQPFPLTDLYDTTRTHLNTEFELMFDLPIQTQAATGHVVLAFELESSATGNEDEEWDINDQLTVDYRVEIPNDPWRRLAIVHDNTFALNRSGYLLLEFPPEAIQASQAGTPRSRLKVTLLSRTNPLPAKIHYANINAAPIVQLQTILRAPLSRTSFGHPNETFELELNGMPDEHTLVLEVEEQGQLETWKATDDLDQATPSDRVFKYSRQENEIVFGNGINGKIPPAGAQVRHLDYPLSEGDGGNQIKGLEWKITGAPEFLNAGLFGTNRLPITGGENRWSLETLRAEARAAILTRDALLTNQHLSNAVLNLSHVNAEKAEVLVGYHKSLPCHAISGSRTVVVTPKRAKEVDPLNPVSPLYSQDIAQRIRTQQVLGEKVYVLSSERVEVVVSATVLIDDTEDGEQILADIQTRLNARLTDVSPIDNDPCAQPVPGEDSIEPWPAGRAVSCQEMKVLIANTPGVVAVTDCLIGRAGEPLTTEDIQLEKIQVAIGATHRLTLMDQYSNTSSQKNAAVKNIPPKNIDSNGVYDECC